MTRCPICGHTLTATLSGYECRVPKGCGWGTEGDPVAATNLRLETEVIGAPGQPVWEATITLEKLSGPTAGQRVKFKETIRVAAATLKGAKALAHEMRFNVVNVSAKEVRDAPGHNID